MQDFVSFVDKKFIIYDKLEIPSVERGICPIAKPIMTDSVIFQCACVKLPYFYFRFEI